MEFTYDEHRIANVFGAIDEPTRREIADLWVGEGVVNAEEAYRRAAEVLFVIRDRDDRLVGVNTVYVQGFLRPGNRYYFMRMFVRPADRRSFGLPAFVSRKTFEFLRAHRPPEQQETRGLIIVTENRKFWSRNAHRILAGVGWHFHGRGPKGNHIFYQNFDGSA
jgi:hypothetical protein